MNKNANLVQFAPSEGFCFQHTDNTKEITLGMKPIKKNTFSVVYSSTDEIAFASVFTDVLDDDDMTLVEIGVGVRVSLVGDKLKMVFSTDAEDGREFIKVYDLPSRLDMALFPLEKDEAIENENMSLSLYLHSGENKGRLYFHFNGEGILFNELFTEEGAGEENHEWEGYFEAEDLNSETVTY